MKPTYAELLEVIRRIGFAPFGPSDASDRDILRDIETLAKQTVARHDASLPIDLRTGDVYVKQPHTGPTLPTLSAEALAVLQDLTVSAYEIRNADAGLISIDMSAAVVDCEIAVWLAALINLAFTPAQPARPLEPDPETSLCDWSDCFEYAQSDDLFCAKHRAQENAIVVPAPTAAEIEAAPPLLDPETTTEAGQLDALLAEGDDRPRSAG